MQLMLAVKLTRTKYNSSQQDASRTPSKILYTYLYTVLRTVQHCTVSTVVYSTSTLYTRIAIFNKIRFQSAVNINSEISSVSSGGCAPVHDELSVAKADAARPLEEDALDAAQLLGRLLHTLLELLPDARHAEEHRRTALADRVQQRALPHTRTHKHTQQAAMQLSTTTSTSGIVKMPIFRYRYFDF